MAHSRLPIHVANKRAFVWDVEDIAKLRSQHHICGILVGTLPHLSQQNVFLGVPLVLMPEEVVLLVEKEIAVLVDDPNVYPEPTSAQLKKWMTEQHAIVQHQQTLFEANVKDNKDVKGPDRAMSEEAIRKRKERELRRQQKLLEQQNSPLHLNDEQQNPSASISTSQALSHTENETNSSSFNITVPAVSSSLEWYNSSSCSYTTIESAKEAGIWDYPSDLHDRAKCGVFRDLWEQGYFMGGGIRFGGDYLIYPGDPLRYHSHFAATVIDSPSSDLLPMEIVAHGRLGTATKKTHLFCGWNDDKKQVSYLSVEWAGFG
ncbi:tRNA-splicing endonuclease subunit [Stygiomarasmius scandens]|uniref:tRNA-splicing endonuclease subunit Sen34 n=1 Tax=Marasmiellus scandens TaxID=2682957 RepID=A0ABR1JV63_9AGAR